MGHDSLPYTWASELISSKSILKNHLLEYYLKTVLSKNQNGESDAK